MPSPPGTSPTPVRQALPVWIASLRVNNGACAPPGLSNIESGPWTGTTHSAITREFVGVMHETSDTYQSSYNNITRRHLKPQARFAPQRDVDGPPQVAPPSAAARRRRSRLLARCVRIAARAASTSWPSMAPRMLACSAFTRRR
jgi:hypothetical protein